MSQPIPFEQMLYEAARENRIQENKQDYLDDIETNKMEELAKVIIHFFTFNSQSFIHDQLNCFFFYFRHVQQDLLIKVNPFLIIV